MAGEKNLQQIIAEADVLVPNSIDTASKVNWLNEINQHFFEVVKIPLVYFFSGRAGTQDYILPNINITLRNIDRVVAGTTVYRSLQMEDVQPGNYGWVFTESNNTMTLSPAPYQDAQGYVRYMQMYSTIFSATVVDAGTGLTLQQKPEAPAAYHEIYVLGLCEKIAKAMDDVTKGNNYGSDYRANLQVAQQNYVKAATKL